MGTWGPGLYANDLAKDLKSTITSVLRLPIGDSEVVSLLQESFPDPSSGSDEEEYVCFWLIVADQFHKLGIPEPQVFKRAREILESGMDAKTAAFQELSAPDQRKRRKVFEELRERIAKSPAKKPRKTLSKPQPLLMRPGDLISFPLFAHNNCINPYSAKWSYPQERWAAFCVAKADHVFGYLAVYHPLLFVAGFELEAKPTKESLIAAQGWELRCPGTCPKLHFTRMKLEVVGQIDIYEKKVAERFPKMRDGRYQAVNDISLSNWLTIRDAYGSIETLGEISRT